MSSVVLQDVRRLIKRGVTAEGTLGKEALKVWKANGFSTFDEEGKLGVKLSVNGPKFKGTIKIRPNGKGYHVSAGDKKFIDVKGEQLTALIDAVCASATAEIAEVPE